MKAKEYREKSTEELKSKILDLSAELFNLKFQHFTGQLENSVKMKNIKKEIGRVMTIISEKDKANHG